MKQKNKKIKTNTSKNGIFNLLNKNVKDFNKIILSLGCISFLFLMGLLSYIISNSYAYFTENLKGKNVIEMTYTKSNLDKSGANEPLLSENMIPVYYDETNNVWRKASANNTSEKYKWYDYDNKMWANSVTVSLKNGTRDDLVKASNGTEIPMGRILTMQVWIPRYKYKVWNYNTDGTKTSNPQEIEITFEENTSKTGEITCTDNITGTDGKPSETCTINNEECNDTTCNEKTYTHPAFTSKEKELTGIWVGKFETTGTIDEITIKPNLISLTNQNISTFEETAINMNETNNIYGFKSTDDIHMSKNSEWGAVAYLYHSKYGRCENGTCAEINKNNCADGTTGIGADSVYDSALDATCTNSVNKYNGTKGILASTTGNIYGIYDMNGGKREYTMANIKRNGAMIYGSSGWTNSNSYPDSKYYDTYNYTSGDTKVESKIYSKLGDAIKEPYYSSSNRKGWYSNDSDFLSNALPWIVRSGYAYSTSGSGIFSFSGGSGKGSSEYSFRLTINEQ